MTAKALRPSLWKALFRLASLRQILLIAWMAFRRGKPSASQAQVVNLRPLGNQPTIIRPGTSDALVVLDTFVGLFHLPPPDLSSPRVIWDLGTNIGLTVAHYASLYPQARVTGLEPDPETANVARQNVAPWADRCQIITGAAWSSDGELTFAADPGEEFGSHVVDGANSGAKDEGSMRVPGYSLSTLLANETTVDFLKVDIEGAEHEILSHNTEWASKVRFMNVEIHPPHTVESITKDLEALDFEVEVDKKHFAAVVARRPS